MDAQSMTRRDFLHASAGVSAAVAATGLGLNRSAYAAGGDTIKLGLIGCGGRGTGAVHNAIRSSAGVELHAMADALPDMLRTALHKLQNDKDEQIRSAIKVTPDKQFVGFDAYRKLLATDVDYVLLALPPYFHSRFFEAAIDAGKHVFVEKPIAIDGPTLRQARRAGEKARQKNLGVLHGAQRRHSLAYNDIIPRIHDGAIGKTIYGEAYWNNPDWKAVPKKPGWSDVEWHIRNWRMARWLCGDLPGVLVIHYLDVMNWAFGAVPVEAYGVGGRKHWVKQNPNGNIYDHFQATLTYADGRRVNAMTRVLPGDAKHSELVVGATGAAHPGKWIKGETNYRYAGRRTSDYVMCHKHMIASIRAGKPLNETQQGIDAALSAIVMRDAAYTGRIVKADFMLNDSQRRIGPDVAPHELGFGDHPLAPVPTPGEYQLI